MIECRSSMINVNINHLPLINILSSVVKFVPFLDFITRLVSTLLLIWTRVTVPRNFIMRKPCVIDIWSHSNSEILPGFTAFLMMQVPSDAGSWWCRTFTFSRHPADGRGFPVSCKWYIYMMLLLQFIVSLIPTAFGLITNRSEDPAWKSEHRKSAPRLLLCRNIQHPGWVFGLQIISRNMLYQLFQY